MNTAVATKQDNAIAIEQVLIQGDLSKLNPQQRLEYYNRTCESLGLNPLTQPFSYITLNGKLTLYAKRDAADQLRKINGVSIEIVSRSLESGLYTVHVRAKDKTGRTDEDFGVVSIGALKGEAAANAILKAVTKAKRRVTLSISGLGWLDETEVSDIPQEARGFPRRENGHSAPSIAPQAIKPPHDPETGEVGPHKIEVPMTQDGSGSDWLAWGGKFVAGVKTARALPELKQWTDANDAALRNVEQEAPKVYDRVKANIDDMLNRLHADSASAPAQD